jgi:hypothetical protein
MLETHLRQTATILLKSAIRIAPPDIREWGQAIQCELAYVEGPWAALMWALGGAGVLAKHALASLIVPGRARGMVPDGGLFAKNISLRKAAAIGGIVCALGALLFFTAPPFRQGIRISLTAWQEAVRAPGPRGQPELAALAKRAEVQHDPEALAFVAARLWDGRECARLAEEAVRLDPQFLWVYAVVAVRHPDLAEIPAWVSKLEQWDPQNALFPIISGECVDIALVSRASKLSPERLGRELDGNPDRRRAMAAAFSSTRFDDYLDRLERLDRVVVHRYRFDDPLILVDTTWSDLPSYAFQDTTWYAKSLLQSAHDLEARGDRKPATQTYWAVARFGQLLDSQARGDQGHEIGGALQRAAYEGLEALSANEGNSDQAALFRYLQQKLDPARQRHAQFEQRVLDRQIVLRNAAVLQISSLTMLLCCGLMLLAVLALIVAGRRRPNAPNQRSKSLPTAIALAAGVGFLLSSATVYLTYRPYWYIFQSTLLNGNRSHARDLQNFLIATEVVPGIPPGHYWQLPVYFWAGVTLLCVSGLVLILLRHFWGRPHAHAP